MKKPTNDKTANYTVFDTTMPWIQCEGYQERLGKNCKVTLEPRPHYCDRGNFIAKLFPHGAGDFFAIDIDAQDGWPRYFFDEARAKAEVEAWLKKRGQI